MSAGQQAAKRARKGAIRTVEAARDFDFQVPAEAAKTVAKRTAKRAAKRATIAAERAARRKTKRASGRFVRLVVLALAVGAVVGIGVAVARRKRDTTDPWSADAGNDSFEPPIPERQYPGAGDGLERAR